MPREYEREYVDESSDYKRKRRSDDDGSTGGGGGSGNGETHENNKEHVTNHGQGPPDGPPLNEKSNAYLSECLEEKKSIDKQYTISRRLLEDEIEKIMVSGRVPKPEIYANVYTEKPIRVSQKVVFPIKDFPKFNFVGKILGPKGNTLRQLQEATFCKMVVMGRNSMRDHAKEEELRNSGNPRFAHLNRDLHVEISTVAPPAEAYHRLACALSEIRKFMIPDANDEIRMEQMREIDGKERAYKKPHYAKPYAEHGAYNSRTPPPPSYEKGNKTKVYSILEKARYVMEDPSYTMMKPHRSRDHELYEHHADYDRYATPPPAGLKHSSAHHVPYEGASYERDYRREYHHQHASSYATAYAAPSKTNNGRTSGSSQYRPSTTAAGGHAHATSSSHYDTAGGAGSRSRDSVRYRAAPYPKLR